jgi:hypothetical protein
VLDTSAVLPATVPYSIPFEYSWSCGLGYQRDSLRRRFHVRKTNFDAQPTTFRYGDRTVRSDDDRLAVPVRDSLGLRTDRFSIRDPMPLFLHTQANKQKLFL